MGSIQFSESRMIDAPPARVYGVLTDYREGHPAILPRANFTELVVEQGGRGAGTVIRVTMKVMGSQRTFRQTVSEPEPGRVLREGNEDAMTTFTVNPVGNGRQSQVTIVTEMQVSSGIRGWLEGLMTPPALRRIYREELENLNQYVRKMQP